MSVDVSSYGLISGCDGTNGWPVWTSRLALWDGQLIDLLGLADLVRDFDRSDVR